MSSCGRMNDVMHVVSNDVISGTRGCDNDDDKHNVSCTIWVVEGSRLTSVSEVSVSTRLIVKEREISLRQAAYNEILTPVTDRIYLKLV